MLAAAAAHPRWKNDGTSGREGERDETTQIDSSAEAEGEARAEIMIRDDATSLYRKRPLCPKCLPLFRKRCGRHGRKMDVPSRARNDVFDVISGQALDRLFEAVS